MNTLNLPFTLNEKSDLLINKYCFESIEVSNLAKQFKNS